MSILKKLVKADKDNKFRTHYYSGSGRYTKVLQNTRVIDICNLLGYKYTTGNDALRGGALGNYVQVSSRAYNNILSLLNK